MLMRGSFVTTLGALCLSTGAAASSAEKLPELMVLGTVHFANPGLDRVNLKVEDVLTPDRQAELETLADALSRYRPSRIAVEWEATDQAGLDRVYAAWRAGERTNRNERQQIAFRLADKLGLDRVDAVDWQASPPGDEAAYDFIAWANARGRGSEVDAIFAPLQADTAALERDMPCLTVSQWLAHANAPDVQRANARSYYPIARLGDGTSAPGATWVGGGWHARNLKIWANLVTLGARPGEHILLVIGAGHRPLVEHFARESGSFSLVDPLKWLPRTPRATPKGTVCKSDR